jgi:hypothetical protein
VFAEPVHALLPAAGHGADLLSRAGTTNDSRHGGDRADEARTAPSAPSQPESRFALDDPPAPLGCPFGHRGTAADAPGWGERRVERMRSSLAGVVPI